MFVIESIYGHALRAPAKAAIVFNNSVVSYARFYRLIMAARAYLEKCEVRPGSVAVMRIDNILDSWVIDLALRSLGLTTIALQEVDEAAALSRLDVGVLVTARGERAVDPAFAPASAMRLEVSDEIFEGCDDDAPLPDPVWDMPDGGHILLTSATTGHYKKVWLDPADQIKTLQALIAEYMTQAPQVPGEEAGRMANVLNFGLWTSSGYSTPLVQWPTGGGVVIYQGDEPWRSFDYPGITHAILTPAFLQAIVNAPPGALKPQPQMQLMIVGGAMSLPLANLTRARLTPKIATTLGSTEAGSWAMTPVETDEDLRLHRVSPNRTLEVVDEYDQAVAAGELGRLRVKIAPGGAAGYMDDEDATASHFRDGWFYPGDLAIRHADGRLSVHGRETEVISILGDKHPTEPFERGLVERLGVEDACVFAMSTPEGDTLHVALQTREPPSGEAVTAALEAVMRGFPKAVVHVVDALPRNHMGKVQRLKLKQMLMARGR